MEKDIAIFNDFLTSTEFEYAMENIKQSLLAYYIYGLMRIRKKTGE